ncbi:MAG: type II secretion system F family protein [Candidatus Eremiobacteraeota bacterium]|nr:type II secretion system F family protein [Candidatus Eremiobacteraeota bacterium]
MAIGSNELRGRISQILRPAAKVNQVDLVTSTRQLAAMLNAGMQIQDCLSFCAETFGGGLGQAFEDVVARVDKGQELDLAMTFHPKAFSTVYVGLVAAGLGTGQLTMVFDKLAEMTEKHLELRRKISAALTYPAVLFVMSMICIGFLVGYVIPLTLPVFEQMDLQLPLITRMLLKARSFGGPALLVGSVAALIGWFFAPWIAMAIKKRRKLRQFLHLIPFMIPVAGKLYRKTETSKILFALVTMLEAGMPLTPAVRRSSGVTDNIMMANELHLIAAEMESGSLLHEAMHKAPLFGEPLASFTMAGEESADIERTLSYLAKFYEEDVDLALADFAAILEPLMMAFMGIVVGGIVLAAMLPVVQLIEKL